MTYHYRDGVRPVIEPVLDPKSSRPRPFSSRPSEPDTARPIGEILSPLVQRILRSREDHNARRS